MPTGINVDRAIERRPWEPWQELIVAFGAGIAVTLALIAAMAEAMIMMVHWLK